MQSAIPVRLKRLSVQPLLINFRKIYEDYRLSRKHVLFFVNKHILKMESDVNTCIYFISMRKRFYSIFLTESLSFHLGPGLQTTFFFCDDVTISVTISVTSSNTRSYAYHLHLCPGGLELLEASNFIGFLVVNIINTVL